LAGETFFFEKTTKREPRETGQSLGSGKRFFKRANQREAGNREKSRGGGNGFEKQGSCLPSFEAAFPLRDEPARPEGNFCLGLGLPKQALVFHAPPLVYHFRFRGGSRAFYYLRKNFPLLFFFPGAK
jgi:hypothetical protein